MSPTDVSDASLEHEGHGWGAVSCRCRESRRASASSPSCGVIMIGLRDATVGISSDWKLQPRRSQRCLILASHLVGPSASGVCTFRIARHLSRTSSRSRCSPWTPLRCPTLSRYWVPWQPSATASQSAVETCSHWSRPVTVRAPVNAFSSVVAPGSHAAFATLCLSTIERSTAWVIALMAHVLPMLGRPCA